ncbi:NADH-quinone oxidoreductase subunit C [Rhodoblastus acidophilus]|uniref:NADH-quinone oxidoreductase subunit C n=1 Tax=Candidatus Rhodoblastus alkanivorans TaxID=2954117 RepID=A0ABS9Z9I9_9HYPH|nr:NADH-quinone oxidoreductase subunit C [Candidatus Rhodoblastus alkanivorans]MCI4679849.1 NADH-quinone oxidoreductase subunit C [Candidatus Rhodoblastus alkanivorans]MCI4684355.1 NADH-quinone oxidoreductase subunit C [Candidatus Rhodoblastus alkanivorans]MDI4641676.1 NADH-quinone oxidoreductase subunit C [Rhodoblastus acidophilus]
MANHRPWPRRAVDAGQWSALVASLAAGERTLLGLWGDADCVHMALLGEKGRDVAVASFSCAQGCFPSVAARHPPAMRFERAIHDLFGYEPIDAPDERPWLDHGRWPVRAPLGDRQPPAPEPPPYPFLTSVGEGLHQIPVGPVHAGIIEPGHFRFTANGETVVRLEERLGYVHKGIEGLMTGAPIARAAKLAGRCSGDSTVAYAIAFARAVEAALAVEIPERAVWLRALMAELERVANHLGDIGAICNDAAFALMLAHCSALREKVLRASAACFGHRLMMDAVVPGGVAVDLDARAPHILRSLVGRIRAVFPRLVELYDNTASLQDRTVATGRLDSALAQKFGCGGFVGRASGRSFDARRDLAYPPYDRLEFEVPVLAEGDVNARVWVRIREVEQSLRLIEQILVRLPAGEVMAATGEGSGEGIALVEGFRGDILAWVRLGGGLVERCHLRDPSWLQWPVLEAAIEGNIVADFPLCNKSFNCSYSGHDL